MLHTYLMVADGWLVAQSAWLNSAPARRAGRHRPVAVSAARSPGQTALQAQRASEIKIGRLENRMK
jgi:hypothetical protein